MDKKHHKKHDNNVELSPSEFAENFLYLKREPFSLDQFPFMRDVYDCTSDDIVLKTSRQASKSTTLVNRMITDTLTNPMFNALYVSPRIQQTKMFSNDRMQPTLLESPIIQRKYYDKNLAGSVFDKKFTNGSQMYFRYCYQSADSIRGISSDAIYYDELQDLPINELPVIDETMKVSDYKWTVKAGTPKRSKGPLAEAWFKSTMNEYLIKCSACNHWNLLGDDNIGKTNLECSKCHSELHPLDDKGEWVSTYDTSFGRRPYAEGFRICTLHFAQASWINWEKDIVFKRENISKQMFFNEVLGIEYDSGTVPITKTEIKAACNEEQPMSEIPEGKAKGATSIMGIDYGPVSSTSSYTVISILQLRAGKLQVVYAKKFVGREAEYSHIHRVVPELFKRFNCVLLASDYGMGESPNSEFRSRLGAHKVMAFQHLGSQKDKMKWQPKMPAWTLNRTQVMTEFFDRLKSGTLLLPRFEDFQPFINDLTNVQIEYDEDKNKTKFINVGPDDFCHATIFAMLCAEQMFGLDSKFY